jgi:hypothetical protein
MNSTATGGLVIGTLLLALVARGASQEPEQQSPPQPAREASEQEGASPAEPTKDLFDVVREWRHKPEPPPPGPEDYKRWMVAAAPVLTYGPTSGFGIGAAGNLALYRGLPATTRITTIVASVTATTKSQVLVNAKINSSTPSNRRRFEGDNRLYWTSQKTYGLGTNTSEGAAVDQEYDYFRFYETQYWKVVPHVFLGAGLLYSNHRNVQPVDEEAEAAWDSSPYIQYSEQYGFHPEGQTSAGLSLSGAFDSRDGPINPSRGWYANLTYRAFFEDFLGGASNWQQLSYDARTYFRLTPDARHKLAFWLLGDFVISGTAPYLDLPATGMDTYGRSGRGYPQGRFRGQDLVYGEVEYRWTMTKNGLFGMVAFLNTETLSNDDSSEKLFDSFATGGGVGFRLMLNKRSLTNLCLDIGWGKDGSSAVYFAVQEAF